MFHLIAGLLHGVFSLVFGAICFIFWLWMLFDAITSTSLDGTAKVVWILVILFIPCGALIYFFAGRRRGVI
jgi:hypothetical protein